MNGMKDGATREELIRKIVMPTVFDPAVMNRKYLDVHYGVLPEQRLDVYLPDEGDGPFPLLIYVHGGGWTMGSRRECALPCIIDAVKCGYALISVDYRLAPDTLFPEFLFDVKTAVRWARANAAQYGFDPDRFGIIGDSAGAHLSLMVGFTEGHPEYEGEAYGWSGESSRVQAVCDMYGPSMLDADTDELLRQSGVPPLFGPGEGPSMTAPFSRDANMLRLISPISYVHREIPPVLIQHGALDPIVPVQHSTELAEKIERVCGRGRVDLRIYPERTHSDGAFMTRENCAEAVEFFDRYLK